MLVVPYVCGDLPIRKLALVSFLRYSSLNALSIGLISPRLVWTIDVFVWKARLPGLAASGDVFTKEVPETFALRSLAAFVAFARAPASTEGDLNCFLFMVWKVSGHWPVIQLSFLRA